MTLAPTALRTSIFSFDCLSVVTQISLYPFTLAAKAKPIPVLPEVPSTIVPPPFNFPLNSASSTILRAMRSLMEFPGLKLSIFASISPGTCLVILFSFTNGVLPIVPKMFS